MARKCILCGTEYKYCKSCKKDLKKETWYSLFDSENCKIISSVLTDYNLERITKDEARDTLSKCDLSIELKDIYHNEINEIMAKPKRGLRAKAIVVDEVIPEDTIVKEAIAQAEEGSIVEISEAEVILEEKPIEILDEVVEIE